MNQYEYKREGWFRPAQFARSKGVDVSTVSKWIKLGKVKSVKSDDGHIFIHPSELAKVEKANSGWRKGRARKCHNG